MRCAWLGLLLVTGLFGPTRTVLGQIDPEPRKLLQLGFNQAMEGAAPIAGYMFYYLNEPNFLRTNLTLRLAVAPVYLDSELGVRGALGEPRSFKSMRAQERQLPISFNLVLRGQAP